MKRVAHACAATTLALMATAASAGDRGSSAHQQQTAGEQQIPVCTHRLGTVAIVEPDSQWWTQVGVGSPAAVIKVFVMKSGCFGLVDRGAGLQSRNMERAMADNGELQQGSNLGRGQVKAADYFIVPDIVSGNNHSGGGGVGAALGGIGRSFGGWGGAALGVAGGINVNKKEASVTLTLTNARTTEQERLTEGYARKSDVSFGGGGGGYWGSGVWGGLEGSGYTNTELGQVIVLAYLDAYTKMVTQLGGLPENAAAAAPMAH